MKKRKIWNHTACTWAFGERILIAKFPGGVNNRYCCKGLIIERFDFTERGVQIDFNVEDSIIIEPDDCEILQAQLGTCLERRNTTWNTRRPGEFHFMLQTELDAGEEFCETAAQFAKTIFGCFGIVSSPTMQLKDYNITTTPWVRRPDNQEGFMPYSESVANKIGLQ